MSKLMFLILILTIEIFTPKFAYPQEQKSNKLKTSLRIFYNHLPDSLFINEELVYIQSDTFLVSEPGIYEIKAVKHCYESFYKKVILLPNRIKPISINLKQHESEEFKLFKTKFYVNSAFSILGAIGYTQIPKGYRGHYLSFGILPIVHFTLNYSKFEPCGYTYIGDIESANDNFKFSVGLSMATIDYKNIMSKRITYVRNGETYHFIQNVNRKINLKRNTYTPAINISVKRKIMKILRSVTSLNFYPYNDLYIEISEKSDSGIYFRKISKKVSSASPFMLEQALDIIVLDNIGQQIGITLGVFGGNPYGYSSKKFVLEIEQPYLPQEVYENEKDIIKVKAENQYGTSLGFFSSIPLLRTINFSTKVKYFWGSDFNFFTINSGIHYNL